MEGQRKYNKRKIKICICTVLILLLAVKIVDVSFWRGYYENYYLGLIKLYDIDEKAALDGVSGWSYVPYEFSDGSRKCTLTYTKPKTGSYNMRIQLDNTGFFDAGDHPEESYTKPIESSYSGIDYFDYEIGVTIGRFDRIRYSCYLTTDTGEICGFDIKDDGSFSYHYGVKDNNKRAVESVKPEIMKIKKELDEEILKKL